jgi:hypothetical protein
VYIISSQTLSDCTSIGIGINPMNATSDKHTEICRLIMNTPSNSTADDNFVSAVGVDVSAANVTDEATVASNHPKDESLRPPPNSLKKLSSPETPRWRFVNKAKKTEGYSSSAAGAIVRGAKVMVSWRLVREYRHGRSHLFFLRADTP